MKSKNEDRSRIQSATIFQNEIWLVYFTNFDYCKQFLYIFEDEIAIY
jgi:hypothetical protein